MFDLKKLAQHINDKTTSFKLEDTAAKVEGNIFIGRFDEEFTKTLMMSIDVGSEQPTTLNKRSSWENVVITFRLIGTESFVETQELCKEIFDLFRENNSVSEVGIIFGDILGWTFIEKVKGKFYKFNTTLRVQYEL